MTIVLKERTEPTYDFLDWFEWVKNCPFFAGDDFCSYRDGGQCAENYETCPLHKKPGVYALELVQGRYYIGASLNLVSRLHSHFTGYGAEWTKKYEPVKVAEIHTMAYRYYDWKDVLAEENELALKYMAEYGWRNVRGGSWTYDLENKPPALEKLEESGGCEK